MKRLLLIIMLTTFGLSYSKSQSLDALWDGVRQAREKDLPKTELAKLNEIVKAAEQQQKYGDLLKAELRRVVVITTLTPDSLEGEVQRLVKKEEALRGNDVFLNAVYCSVLGNVYKYNTSLCEGARDISKDYFKRSLAHPEVLAAHKIGEIRPLLQETEYSSEHFGSDLLHVLANEAGDIGVLQTYYANSDNRVAAMLTALWALKLDVNAKPQRISGDAYLHALDSLLTRYRDISWAGEIAYEKYLYMRNDRNTSVKERYDYLSHNIEEWKQWERVNLMKNDLMQLTRPNFTASVGFNQMRPTERRVVHVRNIRNLNDLTLTLTRVNTDGREQVGLYSDKEFEKLKKKLDSKPFHSERHSYGEPEWKAHTDSFILQNVSNGVYLVEMTSSSGEVQKMRELLYVSDLYLISEEWPEHKIHYVAVSATTGKPVPNANIMLTSDSYDCSRENKKRVENLTTDAKGEATLAYTQCKPDHVWVSTVDDKAFIYNANHPQYYFHKDNSIYTDAHFYTDRALYRPGQTVHVVFFVNKRHPDNSTPTIEGRKATLQLMDTNYKVVGTKEVVTDKYGTAYADFVLPENGLTGRYQIRATSLGSVSFNVEEYKRPTFFVEFETVDGAYKLGDTISVTGKAASYAGVPVQNAKVKYTAYARQASWWRYYNGNKINQKVTEGELHTDSEGKFTLALPLVISGETNNDTDTKDNGYTYPRFYSFVIDADVTDQAGETHHGNTTVPIGTKPTALSCWLPERMEKDSLKHLTFSYTNASGKEIDGNVVYWFDNQSKAYSAKANTRIDVRHLAAAMSTGRHTLHAICGNDTLKEEIILFSINDGKPCIETHDWFYVPKTTFDKDTPLKVQVGSSDQNVCVWYTVIANNTLVDHGMFTLNNSINTQSFKYKEEYGDGLLLTYAWVREGTLYTHSVRLLKPLPDKSLKVAWKTFRNRLEPGQKETWTAVVTTPEGKPADAQMTAVLYDKSLDQIKRHYWSLYVPQRRTLPSTDWRGLDYENITLNWSATLKSLHTKGLYYTGFDSSLFKFYSARNIYYSYNASGMVMLESAPMAAKGKGRAEKARQAMKSEVMDDTNNDLSEAKEDATDTEDNDNGDGIRENFAETGFFFPALHTDEKGEVVMRFTLPESLTTWKFMSLTHDTNTNYGMLTDEVIAKKKVMVQPNMPRFVRAGDEATISARIINTSENALQGKAVIELIDPETGQCVLTKSADYALDVNDTKSVTFPIQLSGTIPLYICKIMAQGANHADGEQHYLAVLPNKALVTNTYPFTLHEPQTKTIDLSRLFAVNDSTSKLTVEYTNNPAWLIVQTLPTYAAPNNENAVDQATSFYVNTLGQHILRGAPYIREVIDLWRNEGGEDSSLASALEKNETLKNMVLNETPWVLDADRESEQKRKLIKFFDDPTMQMRLQTALKKVAELQLSNGAWTWWKDMPGNIYMTVSVVTMFERLNYLLGTPQEETKGMLTKAYKFIDDYLCDEYAEMRKAEKKGFKAWRPSQTVINILYLNALSGRKLSANTHKASEYMIKLMEKRTTEFTIYGKATAAFIFAHNNRQKKADEYMQSIEEYSVVTEEMGRYYDTHKAYYSWYSYQIPTQVAVIEAFKAVKPEQERTVEELQRWLLQAKRTQAWSTPINSVNAIFAFLQGNMKTLDSKTEAAFTLNDRPLTMSNATAGLGYVKAVEKGNDMKALTIEKTSTGTSWGAVYAQFMQQVTEIEQASAQLSVKRELLMADTGEKVETANGNRTLKVGDKVKVRITIKAERDYDFVQVADNRAACMEPIKQLSGYHWGYYIAPRDNNTSYYFNKMPKGTHVIESEYYIDRAGVYQTGTCTAQCAYAPEYAARDKAIILTVTE